MARVKFIRDEEPNIRSLETNGGAIDGALYVATDTGNMWMGTDSNALLKLSNPVVVEVDYTASKVTQEQHNTIAASWPNVIFKKGVFLYKPVSINKLNNAFSFSMFTWTSSPQTGIIFPKCKLITIYTDLSLDELETNLFIADPHTNNGYGIMSADATTLECSSLGKISIKDNGVTSTKIADGAVTKAKLGSDVVIPEAYTLPKATATTLGGVKVGNGLNVTDDGVLSAEDDIVFTWDFNTSAFSCNKTFAEVKKIITTGVRRTATANGLVENFSITLLAEAVDNSGVIFYGTAPTNTLGVGMLGSRTEGTITYLFQKGLAIMYQSNGQIQMTEDLSNLNTNMSFEFKNTTFQYDRYNSFDLKDGGITSAKLANGAITTAKIADGAVTKAKLGSDIVIPTTKADIGLENVDNTADANKSVKYATSAGSANTASVANSVAWDNVTGAPTIPTIESITDTEIDTVFTQVFG